MGITQIEATGSCSRPGLSHHSVQPVIQVCLSSNGSTGVMVRPVYLSEH